jgi:predicted transcriptional regulator
MSKEIITLRIDSEKRIALDRLAQGFDRDRSYILNQAIDYYLHINQW